MKSKCGEFLWTPCFFWWMVIVFAYVGSWQHTQQAEFDIEEATVQGIQSAFKQGKLTSRKLVEFYLHRIEKLNPTLHAVIEVNPDALLLADLADAQRAKDRGHIGGLHGIPVLLKDNIDTKDKLNTTAGSFALLGSKVARDAGVVCKLRKAGAIILGKASLSEWAAFRSFTAPKAWSARGGETKNPYVMAAVSSGSSTGSAVAVSANMAAVSLGTETHGSILGPSSSNGVVGIKPTVGLTSRAGVIPISLHQDTVGPICRTVADAVYVLDEIVGYDAEDDRATKSAAAFVPKGGYKQFLRADGLRGKRLGIIRYPFFPLDPKSNQTASFEQHLATLKQQGAILVDNLTMSNASDIWNWTTSGEMVVLLHDFKHDLNIYLSKLLHSPVRTLADIIAFNFQHAVEEELAEYGQSVFLQAENTYGLNSKAYKEAVEKLSLLTKIGIDKVLKGYKLDALVAPTIGATMRPDGIITTVLAIAGYPGITVPAGYTEGVPFGICFGGDRGSEPKLIEIAYAFEQATKIRKNPALSLKHEYSSFTIVED
eukprot:Gb_24947 [translate_table: standard]